MGSWIAYLMMECKILKKTVVTKDSQIYDLAEKVLKVAALWDTKSELNSREHDSINNVLKEIRDDIKFIKEK
jgi:hypothetical protein